MSEEQDYWEKNGLTKPQQVVVCAAIRFGDIILCGARHHDKIMRKQVDAMGGLKYLRTLTEREEQGFIDQFGDYLSREEAMKIVKKNGQPFDIERNNGDIYLFSEGLY